jgi:hypothetical protein
VPEGRYALKKLAAIVIGGVLLTAVPAVADPVTEKFLKIGGPDRLAPRAKLKVPISCSVGCDTTARTKLKIPGTSIPPDVAKGHLAAGEPKRLVVKLNDTATETIKERPNASRLRVTVRAESNGGQRVTAEKVFEFRAP